MLDVVGSNTPLFSNAHATNGVRVILTEDVEFEVIATNFYWLVGWTIALFVTGVLVFRKRMVA